MKKFNKMLSVLLSLVLCAGLVAPALAVTYHIEYGDVIVDADGHRGYVAEGQQETYTWEDNEDIVVTGETTEHNIQVNNVDTAITLRDVNIDVSSKSYTAAMSITGNGNANPKENIKVTVELDGENTLMSGYNCAGLNLGRGASVTIQDTDKDGGSVRAEGGNQSAGIGSGSGGTAGDITIDGSKVTAIGCDNEYYGVFSGAGIGSGRSGTVGNITIKNGSDVTAKGDKIYKGSSGQHGAGIGCGTQGTAGNITISDSKVTATGGQFGAGIGSSGGGGINVEGCGDIIINGSSKVTATGGEGSAGIGCGSGANAGDILIDLNSEGEINAKGGSSAIGKVGNHIEVGDITIVGKGKVTATRVILGSSITIGDDVTWLVQATNSKGWAVSAESLTGNDILMIKYDWDVADELYFSDSILAVLNKDGETVQEIKTAGDYRSFAFRLPEDGCFIVQKDADGNILNYLVYEDNMAVYKFEDSATPMQKEGLTLKNATTEYVFASGTEDQELPEEVKQLEGTYAASFDAVEVEGGKWVFQKWTNTDGIVDGQLQDTVTFTGTWEFVADSDDNTGDDTSSTVTGGTTTGPNVFEGYDFGSGTTEIEDEEVPLAGLISRADVIGYLWQKAGSPEAELSDFADVPEDHEWAVAIGWAQQSGIAVADEDGNFRPDDLVLRSVESLEISPEGELQEFLNRYAVYAGIELDEGELFIELAGSWDDAIMGEEAQEILNDFFARLEEALADIAA